MRKNNGLFACDNCGAELHFSAGENIKECTYCGNIIALLVNEFKNMEFNKMIPFEVDEFTAVKLLKIYKGSSFSAEPDKLERVYVPFYHCSFDFAFLFNFDDTQNSKYCLYADGKINDSFLPAIKVHERDIFYGLDFVKSDQITTYDPLKAGNYKLLKGNLLDSVNVVEDFAKEYSFNKITHGANNITYSSAECAEFNEKIELVLVPFYVYHGISAKHYILAQDVTNNVKKYNAIVRNKDIFGFTSFLLFIAALIFMFLGKNYEVAIFLGFLCICFLLLTLIERKKLNVMFSQKRTCKLKSIR